MHSLTLTTGELKKSKPDPGGESQRLNLGSGFFILIFMSNSIDYGSCVVCGASLKKQPAATRILWKLYTCHAKSCATVFKSLSDNEQEYIHHDATGDYYLKTKSYIAVQDDGFGEYYYEGDEADFTQNGFKEKYGFGIDELFNSYKTFIEDNNEIREWTRDPYHSKSGITIPSKHFKYIQFDLFYKIYFPPDFSRMMFLGEQYRKLYKLNLNVSSLIKAARNIEEKNFGLCPPCNFSIIRTNHFKQFDI